MPPRADLRLPVMHRVRAHRHTLAVWEWAGEGAPVLLVHATGFHARCWDAVVRRLPGRRIYAIDMPCHGASEALEPPLDWTDLANELGAVIEALGLRAALGVGHSMGGHTLTLAAASRPDAFGALLLIDPVMVEPELAERAWEALRKSEHPVARRRRLWASPEQMIAAFAAREPYSRWDPEVLADYCRHGLRAGSEGEFELACRPEHEAAVYTGSHMRDIYRAIPEVSVPVHVVRARDRRPEDSPYDFSPSPTWERLAGLFPAASDEQLPDRSHFIPMELPDWTAARIAALLEGVPS